MKSLDFQFGDTEKQPFIQHPLLVDSLNDKLCFCWLPDQDAPTANVFFVSKNAWHKVIMGTENGKAAFLINAGKGASEHFDKCPCGDAQLYQDLNVSEVGSCKHGRGMFLTTLEERHALTEEDMVAIKTQIGQMRDFIIDMTKELRADHGAATVH